MPLIEIGQSAPDFTLPDQYGVPHTLAEYRGRPVVLYFYPKDDTSGCTAQACQFRDSAPRFDTTRAMVIGISPDNVASHKKFADKYELAFPILADVPGGEDAVGGKRATGGTPAVCDAYGVWGEKSMYGNTFMGVSRTTYLIDSDGRVVRRWDKVSVPGHAEEVLRAAAELQGVPVPPPPPKRAKPEREEQDTALTEPAQEDREPVNRPRRKPAPTAAREPKPDTSSSSSTPPVQEIKPLRVSKHSAADEIVSASGGVQEVTTRGSGRMQKVRKKAAAKTAKRTSKKTSAKKVGKKASKKASKKTAKKAAGKASKKSSAKKTSRKTAAKKKTGAKRR